MGTFLAIQWLSLHTSSTGSAGLIPGKRTKITSATWSKKQQQSIKLNKIPLYPILFSIFFYWKLLEMLSGSQSLIPLHPFSFEPNPFRQPPITPMKLHSPIFPWLGWLHISVCTDSLGLCLFSRNNFSLSKFLGLDDKVYADPVYDLHIDKSN